MTPDRDRKRAERGRKEAAHARQVAFYLSYEDATLLDQLRRPGETYAEVFGRALRALQRELADAGLYVSEPVRRYGRQRDEQGWKE